MTFREIIEQYKPKENESIIDIIKRQAEFQKLIKKLWLRKDGKFFLSMLALAINFPYPDVMTVNDIEKALTRLGIIDSDADKFFQSLQPILETGICLDCAFKHDWVEEVLKHSEKVDSVHLVEFLRPLKKNTRIELTDYEYLIPTFEAVTNLILPNWTGDELVYLKDRRDCDDFALMFKAFLSRYGLGNLSAALCYAWVPIGGRSRYHAIIAFIVKEEDDLAIKYYEPQTENLFFSDPSTIKPTFMLF